MSVCEASEVFRSILQNDSCDICVCPFRIIRLIKVELIETTISLPDLPGVVVV